MRLSQSTLNAIKKSFKEHFSDQDHLWLFGSRIDPNKKGGDIDLYLETVLTDLDLLANKKIDFLVTLKLMIGEQKIDLVINPIILQEDQLIYTEAKETGIQII